MTCHLTNLVGAFEEQKPRKQFSDSYNLYCDVKCFCGFVFCMIELYSVVRVSLLPGNEVGIMAVSVDIILRDA